MGNPELTTEPSSQIPLTEYLDARDTVLKSEVIFELVRQSIISSDQATRIVEAAFQNGYTQLDSIQPGALKHAVAGTMLQQLPGSEPNPAFPSKHPL
jgi:hypothetical protein